MNERGFDQIRAAFDRRYRIKKQTNLCVSLLIVILGIASILYIFIRDGDGPLTFRWLTVDGTMFTVAGSLVFIAVNLVEMQKQTELTSVLVYYIRLACAVAECIIMFVVLVSQLPLFPEHMHIARFDMFNMHILIPVLTVASFVLNDSPIGKVPPKKRLHGTWYVTIYAVIIITLINTGVIRREMIPYDFLDFSGSPLWYVLFAVLFVYGLGYLLSWGLSILNRRLSWTWFYGIAGNKGKKRRGG